jgi:succinate dehydrogenase/fumarate reductase flavoprotein subunit
VAKLNIFGANHRDSTGQGRNQGHWGCTRCGFSVEWDEELLRLFARESAETYRLLEARGVRFSRLIPRPKQHSIDRMAAVEDGWMLGRAFEPDFASPSVKTHHRSGSTL